MKNNVILFLIAVFSVVIVGMLVSQLARRTTVSPPPQSLWNVQSIDAMKYSRDTARENSTNHAFDEQIDAMMADIAATGATHVGIGTPYDPEFIPYLTRWVQSARRHGLKVWFRGNFAGWESWFEYSKITREEHKKLLADFITNNPGLFENGDILSPCPECENGGPGDPRATGDIVGFRQFLIDETDIANNAFKKINVNVAANYHSMNGDVARLVMNKETTKKLGGIIVVDHYVASPSELTQSIKEFADLSGGKVILGEFGVPIPDLNGDLTEEEQALWLEEALSDLAKEKDLVGLNYWVNRGGSTALWNDSGSARKGVQVLTSFYHPSFVSIRVKDQSGSPLQAEGTVAGRRYRSTNEGLLRLPLLTGLDATITSSDQQESVIKLSKNTNNTSIVFDVQSKSFIEYIKKNLLHLN